MKIQLIILSMLAFLSAASHLWAEYGGRRGLSYLFKPATTIILLLIAGFADPPRSGLYQLAIVTGLAFSLAGDVFLMLPSDRFVAGLASFLAAHLCYIVAFASQAGEPSSFLGAGLFLLYAVVLLRVLWRRLGKLKVPVAVYGLVLAAMGWQAVEQWVALGQIPALFGAMGAVLFVLSDSVLAWERFVRPFPMARLVIMGTYVPAQWLIALSVYH